MKYYNAIQKINLAAAAVERAKSFAAAVLATVHYGDSKQINPDKISIDHFISKLGEEAAATVLKKFAHVQGPDYTIYPAAKKSWKEDLLVNGMGVAVKTQSKTSAQRYGLSWTFQCGKKRRDLILQDPLAWVVFVAYDDSLPYTCFVYPPYQIKELQFSEPKLSYLKDEKKVVYAAQLPIHKR